MQELQNIEVSIWISNEDLRGQTMNASLESLQGETNDPRKLEIPRIWSIDQGKQQAVSSAHTEKQFYEILQARLQG